MPRKHVEEFVLPALSKCWAFKKYNHEVKELEVEQSR